VLGPFSDSYSYSWSDGSTNPYLEITGNEAGVGYKTVSVIVTDTNACNKLDTVIINIVPTTYTQPNENKSTILIYPNPTDGLLSIDLGATCSAAEISITDLNGRIIQKEARHNSQILQINLDAEPGVYLGIIEYADKRVFIKLLRK